MKKFLVVLVVFIGISLTTGNCYAISDEEIFKIALEDAQNGSVEAQEAVGYMYEIGIIVKQDYKKAVEWYEKAAIKGLPQAQYNLGFMYYNSQGVRQNYKKALEWYKKAASQGYSSAQNNIGFMYDNGKGVR